MARTAAIGLALIGAYSISVLARRSAIPGNYYEFRNSSDGFVYPMRGVVTWSLVIAVEVALSVLVLLRAKAVPSTCLLLGLAHGLGILALGIFAMHAPPSFGGHLVYLFFGGAWLLVMWTITGLASLRSSTDVA